MGVCFIALAVYITYEALADLTRKTAPERSIPGIVLACVSLIVMPVLTIWETGPAIGKKPAFQFCEFVEV